MGVLIGGFLIIFGLIFFLVGGGIGFLSALLSGHFPTGVNLITQMAFGGTGFIILLIGVIMVVRGLAKAKKLKAKAMLIFERGVPAEGTVTFVDKNYSMLINQKPIYSIVEFKFRDGSGVERVSRKNDVNSDLVIRLKIEVGSKVQVKYLNEDPSQNILLLPDPKVGG